MHGQLGKIIDKIYRDRKTQLPLLKSLEQKQNVGRKNRVLCMPPSLSTTSESESRSVVSNSLGPQGLSSWNSPGQNTGVGSLSRILQRIFVTQRSNPGLPHYRQILYQLSHKGSPRILEWGAYPFSNGSPDPGIEPGSPALQADSLPAELPGKPTEQTQRETVRNYFSAL